MGKLRAAAIGLARAGFDTERLRRDSILIAGLGDGAVRIATPPSLSRLTFLRG